MTERKACSPAPGPLEDYARRFADLLGTLAQRRGFREYLQGLLLPRDRNRTLTALANAEPVAGAQHPAVQRLQFFLSESGWDAAAVNARRLALLVGDPVTAPHGGGVLVVDDTGDRKDGAKTAHVARQYLGSVGKVDNGIVAVSTLWADERLYYPLHAVPYTPAARLPRGDRDPAFRTKPQLAADLVAAARAAGVPFRAVVADSFYGDNLGFEEALLRAGLPFVLALKPTKGTWAPAAAAHTPEDAARRLRWGGPAAPGDWRPVRRRFRDGHEETWWAADARLTGYGPDRALRLVVATTDPTVLPPLSTWYLGTNLPHPDSPRPLGATAPFPPAELPEVVRLYGLRIWVEQGYRQVKNELGWADFQVRADRAIRRHWTLVTCAFSFCWHAPPAPAAGGAGDHPLPPHRPDAPTPAPPTPAPALVAGRGKNARAAALLAGGPARRARLAGALGAPPALLARLVHRSPARHPARPPRRYRHRPPAPPLPPALTHYT
jgi:SRSO17 transposase